MRHRVFSDIDAALDDSMRDAFRRWVGSWDIERRLGTTDDITSLHGDEWRWTPEWERRLAVAAEGYRARADEAARDALAQTRPCTDGH